MTLMKIFFMDIHCPTRKIRELEVEIRVCKKSVWALLPDGRRRLVGSSVFFTLASATRAQMGCLQKRVESKPFRYLHPEYHAYAVAVLEKMQQENSTRH